MTKVNLTEEDLKDRGNKTWFDVGEHTVVIESLEHLTDSQGRDYLQWKFADANDPDIKGDCRNYLHTEKSAKFAISIMKSIASHNAIDDKEKEKVKATFLAITDTDELKKLVARYENMEAFIQVYEDENAPNPNGGFYRRTNIMAYMPKPRKTTVEQIMGSGTPVATDDVPFN